MCLAVPGKIISIVGDDPLMRTGKVSFGVANWEPRTDTDLHSQT